jgi:hypothetical protein
MVEYCDTPETERREQTGNTKHTYTLEASSLLDREPQQPFPGQHIVLNVTGAGHEIVLRALRITGYM